MWDSREIANAALRRAEMLRTRRKRRLKGVRNMQKTVKRFIAFTLSLIMLLGLSPPGTSATRAENLAGSGGAGGFVSDDNGYIKYYVNEEDGSFYIMPSVRELDDGRAPSFAMFRINGREYRFGENAPGAQGMIAPFKNPYGTTQTTWYFQDYIITQYLNIIQEDESENSYAVYVGYEIMKDGEAVTLEAGNGISDSLTSPGSLIATVSSAAAGTEDRIEARIVLDTQFGENDDQPVMASGYGKYISNEIRLDDVPQYFRMDENISGEGPYAYGLLTDSRYTTPSALTLAHFQSLTEGGFDYAPREEIDFTSPNNPYGASDSGVALDFAVDITGQSDVTIGTIYGFSGLKNADEEAAVIAPMMALNANGPVTPGVSGDINDGVDIDELYKPGNGIYYGTYKHATEWGDSWSTEGAAAHESNPTSILWRVMGEELTNGTGDGYITLMSEYLLDAMPFNEIQPNGNRYGNSLIQNFLAGEFMENFSAAEKDETHMIPTTVVTRSYMWTNLFSGDPDATTVDDQQTYLLWGINDTLHYPDDLSCVLWSASGTLSNDEGENERNALSWKESSVIDRRIAINMAYLKNDIGRNSSIAWWLRSPAYELITPSGYPATVHDRGRVGPMGSPMDSYNGVRPAFKLNPSSVIFASEIVEGTPGPGETAADYIDNETLYNYTTGADGKTNYKLTVLGGTDGADVGTLDFTQLIMGILTVYHEPASDNNTVMIDGFSAEPNYADPDNPDHDSYTVNYKIVDEVDGKRQIVQYGSQPIVETALEIDLSNLTQDKIYDVYAWLQRGNPQNSNEGTMPLHFQIEVERVAYNIETAADTDCGITVSPSAGLYYSDDVITISGITIPNPSINNYQLKVFGKTDTGAMSNIDLTAGADGSYTFKMPPSDVEIRLSYYSKESTVIKVESNERGNVTLDKYAGLPGDVITVTAQQTSSDHYVERIELYKTWSRQINENKTETVEEKLENADVSFSAGKTASFTIPADIGSKGILVKIITAETPINTVSFPSSLTYFGRLIDVIPDNSGGKWTLSNGQWTSESFLPGQKASFKISPGESFWKLKADRVSLNNSDLEFSTSVYDFGGQFSMTVGFTMPTFTNINDWTSGGITVGLSAERTYRPYTVTAVTPNTGAFANQNSFTVRGTYLEQIVGQGIDFQVLSAEQQQITQTVTFGNSSDKDLNPRIPSDSITLMEDGSLSIAISQALKDQLEPNANGTFYLSVGNITRVVSLNMNYLLRYTPFSVLGVVSGGSYHSIVLADNDTDLLKKADGRDVLVKIKGTVSWNESTNTFYFAAGKAMFNNTLVYDVKEDNGLSVREQGGTVTVSGSNGVLSVPGLSLGVTMPVNCTIENGTRYRTDDIAEEGADFSNISIEWPQYEGDLMQVAAVLGMTAEISNIRLIDKAVVFGGKLSIGLPESPILSAGEDNSIANIDLQRLQYGLNENGAAYYQGAVAEGGVKLPDGFKLSFIDFNTEAWASINTFENTWAFEMDINIQIFEFEASLYLTPINGNLAPDSLKFFIAADPGIEVIPAILQIKGGGGGFEGAANTFSGNFDTIPPFRVYLKGRVSVVEILSMDAEWYLGANGFRYSGNPSIGKGPFSIAPFSKYEYGVDFYSDGFSFDAAIEVSLVDGFEMFVGGGNMYVSYRKHSGGLSFSGALYCRIQVPRFKFIFWFGPYTIADVYCGVNNTGVNGSLKLLGFIKVSVWYDWGASSPGFSVFSAVQAQPAEGDYLGVDRTLYDENGNYIGEMSFGDNLKLVARHTAQGSGGSARLMSSALLSETAVYIELTGDNQFIMVNAPREGLRIYYSTDDGATYDKQYTLYYPRKASATDEDPYTESELNAPGINAIDYSYENEPSIMVGLDKVLSNYWKIVDTNGGSFECNLIEAEPLPELTEASLSGNIISWKAENLKAGEEYMLDVFLSTSSEPSSKDYGALYPAIQDHIITQSNGTITLSADDLPENMPTGDYYAWVYLKTKGDTKDILDSNGNPVVDEDGDRLQETEYQIHDLKFTGGTLGHVNTMQPGRVQAFTVSSAGNGSLKAQWDKAGDDVYYQIIPFDKNGDMVMRQSETEELSPEPYIYNASPDMYKENSAGRLEAYIGGLPAGAEYRLEITPYRYIESADSSLIIMGTPTMSETVTLPEPDYPKVSASFENAVTYAGSEGYLSVYSANDYTINLAADQDCRFTVTENGKITYESAGPERSLSKLMEQSAGDTSKYVIIKAVNNRGDMSWYYYNSYYDNVKPVLFIETNEDGIIIADDNGEFPVKGTTKPLAEVSLYMDQPVSTKADEEGKFELVGVIPVSAARSMENLKLITVGSQDSLGNTETANVRVLSQLEFEQDILSIDIIPDGTISVKTGGSIDVGGKLNLRDGSGYTVYGSSLRYEITSGADKIVINEGTGNVTAVSAGTARVRVSVTSSGGVTIESQELEIVIEQSQDEIRATGVSLDKAAATITVGGSVRLTARVTPSNATNQNVTWASSDESVASVSANGSVTGISAGTARITVTTADGGYTAACTVTVTGGSSGGGGSNRRNSSTYNDGLAIYAGREEDISPEPAGDTKNHSLYISGYGNGAFGPDNNMTRAEAAAVFYKLLDDAGASGKSFTDVPASAWYYDAVYALSGLGIITGYEDGSFRPNDTITRAEFTSMAMRFAGVASDTGGNSFSDVGSSHWAFGVISAAAKHGYVSGYPDGSFDPDGLVTRAEAVSIVNRIRDCEGIKAGASFSDVPAGHWAYEVITAAATDHKH